MYNKKLIHPINVFRGGKCYIPKWRIRKGFLEEVENIYKTKVVSILSGAAV